MKRTVIILTALMLAFAPEANAQAFLKKLKDKAASAVSNAIVGKASGKESSESSRDSKNDDDISDSQNVMNQVMTPEQQLQRRRTSTFSWNEKVTPSTTSSPLSLMAELPSVPSAQELANPTEEAMTAFYTAIKKVTLRAEELNLDTTCEDEFTLQWRKQKEQEIADAFGLTRAEMDLLNSENITDEQREKIEAKVRMKILGGVDVEGLQARAESGQFTAADMANLKNIAKNVRSMQDKIGTDDLSQAMTKLGNATRLMEEAIKAGSDIDAKFSAAERKKILALKDQIYSTNDPAVYNPLYLQALESIKTYRTRAAGLWSAAVQKRINNIKAQLPDYIKAQKQAVADGVLPDCGANRAPLNVVIEAGDILEEAYSEFPCNYPPMYKEEVIDHVCRIWWPEFYVAPTVDDILAKKYLYKIDDNGDLCEVKNGKLVKIGEDFYKKTLPTMKQAESAVWKSSDGKREVIYNAKGQWLQLPEGDVVNPTAIQKYDNEIVWIKLELEDIEDQWVCFKIIKCTYKL